MHEQAAATPSTTSTSDAARRHTKRRGTSQAAKWNASLASKIKTKLMNNSSMFKVSLKQNNKALAVALSVEKENSRRLRNDKIFLQKEVEKLQLHNFFLRRKLSCLNKTLTEIEAYLNNNLITAIELSSLSESVHSFLHLSAGPSVPADDQFQSTHQSARPVGLPVKLPLIATARDCPAVCEIPNASMCTTVLSKEMHSGQVKFALPLPPATNHQSLIETVPVETTIDKNRFLKENQLCTELTGNRALPPHVRATQPLRQPEDLPIQSNDSSLPFCGNGTERKKGAGVCKSKTQPNRKDLEQKCSPDKQPHRGIGSSSNTSEVNLQSSDSSHLIPSPLKFVNESKRDLKKQLLIDKVMPEETLYDADMDLTASDAGELLTVTAKDKEKLHPTKSRNANSDKILAHFRKVKYPKKDKEKIKSNTEVASNLSAEERDTRADNGEASKTDSQPQLSQSQPEQLSTGNSLGKQNLQNSNKHHKAQHCTGKAKDTVMTHQDNFVSPRKQKTNPETSSETSEDTGSKIQKADSNSSNNEIPAGVYCAENLPFQDNTSGVLSLPGNFLPTNEMRSRSKIIRKTFQNPSKMNTAKYHRHENGQNGEYISKKSQTEIHQHDSKREQDQKNIIKRKDSKKGSYSQSGDTDSDSIHRSKFREVDQKIVHSSPGRLKCTLANASQRTNVTPKETLQQLSLGKNEELKYKDVLHAENVIGNKTPVTQQMQVAAAPQNDAAVNTPQATEQVNDDANTFKKVNVLAPSSVAHKPPHISNYLGNQVKQKQRFSSGITETRPDKKYFRHTDKGRQTTLDYQEVSHEMDSFMSKLKPVVQTSTFECSKKMPLNVDSFFQERLSSAGLPALHNHNTSRNFFMLKNSEVCRESVNNKTLNSGKLEQKLDRSSEETHKKTLTSCHGRKALQDLTNASIQSPTSLPKSPKTLEEKSARPSRQARATICYKEPSLISKLRRGDPFTDVQFLHSPVKRVKNKGSFKSKSKFT